MGLLLADQRKAEDRAPGAHPSGQQLSQRLAAQFVDPRPQDDRHPDHGGPAERHGLLRFRIHVCTWQLLPPLGASESVGEIYATLPPFFQTGQEGFEFKVVGLAAIFAYSFFKFGWAYRLFNYCTILFGSIPMPKHTHEDPAATERAVERVIELNILAGKHFNAGLRGIFLSIGYIGWFLSPVLLIALTAFVIGVLVRRQFFSEARAALL